ncbi:MAG: hypothetical protein ABI663_07725 [Chryseolinea sp.]
MKHKILSIMAIGVLIVASSCDPKPNHETQVSSKTDSVVVKSDSTLSTEPSQDSLQSK